MMIVVRDVFQLKVGKAKEAKTLFQEVTALMKKYGMTGHGWPRAPNRSILASR